MSNLRLGPPFIVAFKNPGTKRLTIRSFKTREEAQKRVDHYREKYGRFHEYEEAIIAPEPHQERQA